MLPLSLVSHSTEAGLSIAVECQNKGGYRGRSSVPEVPMITGQPISMKKGGTNKCNDVFRFSDWFNTIKARTS